MHILWVAAHGVDRPQRLAREDRIDALLAAHTAHLRQIASVAAAAE
jgi:hypothetical protein